MPKYPCPVCGDPNAYPMWLDKDPPDRCPEDYLRDEGVTSALRCKVQQSRALSESIRRRCAPDCFDDKGAILPGKLSEIITRTATAGYDPMCGIPRLSAEEWNSYVARHRLFTGADAEAAEMRALGRPVDNDNDGEPE